MFDRPSPYPGPSWTRNGKTVGTAVVASSGGPQHCNWQSATFLTIGWPLGTAATRSTDTRLYIRDPHDVVASPNIRGPLQTHATMPADARQTGFKVRGVRLYLAPSDEDSAAYLVVGSDVERWPRSDPMTLCA